MMRAFLYGLCVRCFPLRKAAFYAHGFLQAVKHGHRQPAPKKCVSHRAVSAQCLELSGASVYGHGAVITKNNSVLKTASPDIGTPADWHRLNAAWCIATPRHVSGDIAVLSMNSQGGNYYHWLLEAFPRLAALPHGYAGKFLIEHDKAWQREYLEMAGVNLADCIQPCKGMHLRPDRLFVPLMTDKPGEITEDAIRFLSSLRDRNVSLNRDPVRKIYMARVGVGRSVANEGDLWKDLYKRGFEKVDMGRLSVLSQMQIMAQAHEVVAVHGAALANLVFCRPGTQVTELRSIRYNNFCFETLAKSAGMAYTLKSMKPIRTAFSFPITESVVYQTA